STENTWIFNTCNPRMYVPECDVAVFRSRRPWIHNPNWINGLPLKYIPVSRWRKTKLHCQVLVRTGRRRPSINFASTQHSGRYFHVRHELWFITYDKLTLFLLGESRWGTVDPPDPH